MADGGGGATCPLCGLRYQDAATYASHLADAHGLVDDEGAPTRLPSAVEEAEPEPEPLWPEEDEPEEDGEEPTSEPEQVGRRPARSLWLWRRSLGLAVRTLAVLLVLASVVAIVASLADTSP